ncbi:hypothetical protein BDN72DRAFT_858250 [Pluteus cervinus]|uniref:Uncharacterized protein n=1 Tax=Pluteus cervinus TaxID=181527 RepID=A0ACD3ATP8_9AGAR|nr:hypothetical protein BDN72DRAFT_858250 [Pluteus cervinus]
MSSTIASSNASHKSPKVTVRGYLFPTYGTIPEYISLRVKKNAPKRAFPDVNFKKVFVDQEIIHSIRISIGPKHFMVAGYLQATGPENESLAAITRHIKWRGEIVVIGLGARAQFLYSPSGPRDTIHAAVSVFMARVIEGKVTGVDPPKQISIDEEGPGSSQPARPRRTRRTRRTRRLTSADFRFDTPEA